MADLFLNWGLFTADPETGEPAYNVAVPDGTVQSIDTGGVAVSVSYSAEDAEARAFSVFQDAYVEDGEPFSPTSHLKLLDDFNNDGEPPTSRTTFEFSSTNPTDFTDEVQNVQFRLNDIDLGAGGDMSEGGNGWKDFVTVTAFNAAGEEVPVDLSALTVGGQTVAGATTTEPEDQAGSVLVSIEGPVQRFEVVYENAGDSKQTAYLTDVHFSTVDVDDANGPPVAVDDPVSTDEDTAVEIDVLTNDSDPDGDPLTVVDNTDPANGTVTNDGGGVFTYTPDPGFTGTDSFEYTITDGTSTDTATVTITVAPVNEPPLADPDTATTTAGSGVVIDVLANDSDPDGDPLTVTDTSDPANGSVVINGDGTVTYTPDDGFSGTDTFTYTVSDGTSTSTAAVTVTVDPGNQPPLADADAAVTPQGEAVVIEVLANDSDPDGDTLTITGFTDPANGSVADNGDGTLTYTPDAGFVGSDMFDYTITDPAGETSTATVTVSVTDERAGIDTDVFPVPPALQGLDPLDGLDEDANPDNDRDLVDGDGTAEMITTGDDADTINAGGGNDTVEPGIDDDFVRLGGGDDMLFDIQGADTILGGQGNDTIEAGTDTFSDYENDDPSFAPGSFLRETFGFTADPNTEDGRDSVQGNQGDDSISTGDDSDTIDGGQGNDTIDGGIDDDLIRGAADDDSLIGGHGSDTIDGGQGNDFIDGSNIASLEIVDADDPQTENDRDSLIGALGDDTLIGGDDDDTLIGGSGDDSLDGGIDDDLLLGGNDDDTLIGGQGNDTLNGGAGFDSIFGGDDRDVIVVDRASDMIDPTRGSETVDGGSGGDDFDRLDLRAIGERGEDWRLIDTRTDSDGNGLDGTVEFLDSGGAATGSFDFVNIEEVVPCFTPGTLIATPDGARAVEDLAAGDRVITRDNGIQEVIWAGRKTLDAQALAVRPHLRPVRIRKGALGAGLPERDMLVSPQHRVLMVSDKTALYFDEREVLVAAKHLIGMDGIESAMTDGVTYVHVMFAQHEVILSDGAWTESFQPGDYSLNGMDAAQRDEILELFPELADDTGLAAYGAARRTLKRHEALLLTQ